MNDIVRRHADPDSWNRHLYSEVSRLPPDPPPSPGVKAVWGETLARALGINVHYKFAGNSGLVYRTANCSWYTDALIDMGIRTIRDRLVPNSNGGRVAQRLWFPQLRDAGTRIHVSLGTFDTEVSGRTSAQMNTDVQALMDEFAQYGNAAAVERIFVSCGGVNEPNGSFSSHPNWYVDTAKWQEKIFDAVKARYPNMLVLSPANHDKVGTDAQRQNHYVQLASQGIDQHVDVGDFHHYSGGIVPSGDYDSRIKWMRVAYPAPKPIMSTEGGFNVGIGITTNGMPVSDQAAAVYAPRHLMETWIRNVQRWWKYELLNDPDAGAPSDYESWWGCIYTPSLDPATWTKGLQFYAFKNFLSIIGESGRWDAPSYTTTPLPVEVTGGGSNFKWRLFQKSNGKHLVIMWRDVSVYNYSKATGTGSMVTISPVNAVVKFETSKNVSIYSPTDQATPTSTPGSVTQVSVPMDGKLKIVEVG